MNTKEYETKELLSRFAPYYKPHMGTLCMDLSCAALTTICELVLPLIMYIREEISVQNVDLKTMLRKY